ncbi:MAG: GNAT family N-acetyltransferase [Candidatus Paceibacterota bacterium]
MKTKLKLVLPNKKYLNSFYNGMQEVRREPKKPYALPWTSELKFFKNKKDFPAYLIKKRNDRLGIGLDKDHVPQTVYWAIKGSRFIGLLKIRHRLWRSKYASHIGYAIVPTERNKGYATQILRWGVRKAKSMGIKKIIVGCDAKNYASKRVIEKNNGFCFKKLAEKGRQKLIFYIKL